MLNVEEDVKWRNCECKTTPVGSNTPVLPLLPRLQAVCTRTSRSTQPAAEEAVRSPFWLLPNWVHSSAPSKIISVSTTVLKEHSHLQHLWSLMWASSVPTQSSLGCIHSWRCIFSWPQLGSAGSTLLPQTTTPFMITYYTYLCLPWFPWVQNDTVYLFIYVKE